MAALRSRHINSVIYIVVVSVFSISQGLTYPLFSFRLSALGYSDGWVGLSAMMTPLGVVLSSFFLPMITRRHAVRHLLLSGVVLTILCIGVLAYVDGIAVWMIVRLALGLSINLIYITTENALMQETRQGRNAALMGWYVASSNLGYAVGPGLLSLGGTEGMAPFVMCIGLIILASTPILWLPSQPPPPPGMDQDKRLLRPLFEFMARHPLIVTAYVASSFFDTCIMNMLPLLGLAKGVEPMQVTNILFVLVMGGVLCQAPAGKWLDRHSVSRSMLMLAATIVALCAVLPFYLMTVTAYVIAFTLGGAVLALQTAALACLSRQQDAATRAVGNASNAFFWGLASIIGMPGAGWLMHVAPVNALMGVLAAPFVLLILIVAVTAHSRLPH